MFNLQPIIRQIMSSANPNQMLMQAAQKYPPIQQAMQVVNGKTPVQIRDMAYGIAKQQGVDLNSLAHMLGFRLPK